MCCWSRKPTSHKTVSSPESRSTISSCLWGSCSSKPRPTAQAPASGSSAMPVAGSKCPFSGLLSLHGAPNTTQEGREAADSAGAANGGSKCPFSGLLGGHTSSGSRAQAASAQDTAPSHGTGSSEGGAPETPAQAERKGGAAVCPMGFGGGASGLLSALHCTRRVRCLLLTCTPATCYGSTRQQDDKLLSELDCAGLACLLARATGWFS